MLFHQFLLIKQVYFQASIDWSYLIQLSKSSCLSGSNFKNRCFNLHKYRHPPPNSAFAWSIDWPLSFCPYALKKEAAYLVTYSWQSPCKKHHQRGNMWHQQPELSFESLPRLLTDKGAGPASWQEKAIPGPLPGKVALLRKTAPNPVPEARPLWRAFLHFATPPKKEVAWEITTLQREADHSLKARGCSFRSFQPRLLYIFFQDEVSPLKYSGQNNGEAT